MPSNGAFVQQTPIFPLQDGADLQTMRQHLVILTQAVNNLSLVLNMKDTGYYDLNEFICGQVYFPIPDPNGVLQAQWRPVFRKVIDVGAISPLPNNGCIAIPHNIPTTANYFFVRQYGEAYSPGMNEWITFPYASATAAGDNIEMNITASDINICSAADYSSYTKVNVILEYVQTN